MKRKKRTREEAERIWAWHQMSQPEAELLSEWFEIVGEYFFSARDWLESWKPDQEARQ